MTASKNYKVALLREFVEWFNANHAGFDFVPDDAIERFVAATMIECDTAIMHGPGHQSISECTNTRPSHTNHFSDMGHEWDDDDITSQTHTKYRHDNPPGTEEGAWVPFKDRIKTPLETYRLASEPY